MYFLETVKEIDYFGKIPEFYIKGKPKQVTLIGRIFTFIYIILYLIILGYKIYRMSVRIDITFYDSYSNLEETPSIQINNENFYTIFTIFDDSDNPFIDETIYYPLAYFFDGEMQEIEIERCNINKIGSKYRTFFQELELEKYYCLSNINYNFISYMNSVRIKIFPCKNTTLNNNHCKSKEIIDTFLNGKNFAVQFEDILITPLYYKTPVKERMNTIFTTVFPIFGQYLYTEMQIVQIETLTNIVGFDFFSDPKVEKFIKYSSLEIIPQPGYDLNDDTNDYPICEIEFQLNDKILLEKRQYTQLIDVLGEVGGFMEFIYSFFGMICSFIVNILYKKKIANNLFTFDLHKKLILFKERKNIEFQIINNNIEDKEENKYSVTKHSDNLFRKSNKKKLAFMNTMNQEIENKNSENYSINQEDMLKIKKNELKGRNSDIVEEKNNLKHSNKNKIKFFPDSLENVKTNIFTKNKTDSIIDKIKSEEALFFCFKRKKRKVYKLLLEETMNIIIEKLDIFNIFRNICSNEMTKNYLCQNKSFINMSVKCINNILNINHK